MEMNTSEPPFKCRNHGKSDIKTRASLSSWDKRDWGNLFTAFLGVRHRGGMNLTLAKTWNYGNLSLSCKWKRDKQRSCELESTDGQHRGRVTRSSDEALVMSMERRGYVIQFSRVINSIEDEF